MLVDGAQRPAEFGWGLGLCRSNTRLGGAVLAEYQPHYNMARPHQGIAQRVPDGEHDGSHVTVTDLDRERIRRKPILGGLINEYARAA